MSTNETNLTMLLNAIEDQDIARTKAFLQKIKFEINDPILRTQDFEEYVLQTALEKHLHSKTERTFEILCHCIDHDHLNVDKDMWGDGRTSLMRSAQTGDQFTCFALLGRGANVLQKNQRDSNKNAIDYAFENGHKKVCDLLKAERDGTEDGMERFVEMLDGVELPKDDDDDR
jgi:hypothetical protein